MAQDNYALQQKLPSDERAETNILGTMMCHEELFVQVEDVLDSSMFYVRTNQAMFRILKYIIQKKQVVDESSIMACYEKFKGKIGVTAEEVDIAMMEIAASDSPSTFMQDVERIVEYSVRRKTWETMMKMAAKAITLTDNADDTITEAVRQLDSIRGSVNADSGIIDAKDAVKMVYDQINDNLAGMNTSTVKTGFRFSDAKGGIRLNNVVVIGAWTSVGKALPMDANILTPEGWVKNKDIKVGQKVCSVDGSVSYVTNIFKRGVRDMYNITFNDGRVVKCCGEHLWEVYHPDLAKPMVIDTLDIKRRQEGTKYHNRMRIPAFCGEFGDRKDFVIPPYVLGVLIGDGSLTKGLVWSKPDTFIEDKIRSLVGVKYIVKNTAGKYNHSISTKRGQRNEMLETLSELGLRGTTSKDRFIPKEYLESCREQRLELLNGLLDTDGYASKEGHCTYSTSSERLSKDVLYLCHSLGFRASISSRIPKIAGKEYSRNYEIVICSDDDTKLFTLPRKKERTRKRNRNHIIINSVEYAGREECQCITVSHERGLYVTDGFIVTHNSSLAMNIAVNAATAGYPVAYYSLEMGAVELWSRIFSSYTNISAGKILSYPLRRDEVAEIDRTSDELSKLPIYIDDKATTRFSKMIRSVRTMVKKHGIKMFVVDYLQIFAQNNKSSSEESNIASMARECKNICRELNICCLLLSQLRRDKDERHPTIDMLRGSGQIEESADNIVLIDRPDAHPEWGVSAFGGGKNAAGLAELRVCKGRNIGLGTYYVGFDSNRTQFYELDGYKIGDEIGYDDGKVVGIIEEPTKEQSEPTTQGLPF